MSTRNACSIIAIAANEHGVHQDELNYSFGCFFVTWCRSNGYDKVRLPYHDVG